MSALKLMGERYVQDYRPASAFASAVEVGS